MSNNLKESNPAEVASTGSLMQVTPETRAAIWQSGCVGGHKDYETLFKVACGPLLVERVRNMLYAVPCEDESKHVFVFRFIDLEPWTNI